MSDQQDVHNWTYPVVAHWCLSCRRAVDPPTANVLVCTCCGRTLGTVPGWLIPLMRMGHDHVR